MVDVRSGRLDFHKYVDKSSCKQQSSLLADCPSLQLLVTLCFIDDMYQAYPEPCLPIIVFRCRMSLVERSRLSCDSHSIRRNRPKPAKSFIRMGLQYERSLPDEQFTPMYQATERSLRSHGQFRPQLLRYVHSLGEFPQPERHCMIQVAPRISANFEPISRLAV